MLQRPVSQQSCGYSRSRLMNDTADTEAEAGRSRDGPRMLPPAVTWCPPLSGVDLLTGPTPHTIEDTSLSRAGNKGPPSAQGLSGSDQSWQPKERPLCSKPSYLCASLQGDAHLHQASEGDHGPLDNVMARPRVRGTAQLHWDWDPHKLWVMRAAGVG